MRNYARNETLTRDSSFASGKIPKYRDASERRTGGEMNCRGRWR